MNMSFFFPLDALVLIRNDGPTLNGYETKDRA